ncbi:nucleotide-binding universal stress UspA family protein [Inquilinus ginsengisoli]|uniref:Nucleotide-binding universal stress UspA family protein n=1 Tax=Inquilinus ginsengisoli TaxID=363840 RepID=A0ABU1JKT9_9PROT|nr:universal stress protein [Inquilinus ginsengisoli]MDR6288165.1 nucleotide-binding universal stress UspA family protein [Inquilinus ginsengisoli]
MPIRKILVPVTGKLNDDSLLDAALAMAREQSAAIELLYLRPSVVGNFPGWEFDYGAWSEEYQASIEASVQEAATAAHRYFDGWRHRNHLGGESDAPAVAWREQTGIDADLIGAAGRVCDLIVTRGPENTATAWAREVFEGALLASGRPVLMVPDTPFLSRTDTVLIAWNDSVQSARAVAGALPLLSDRKWIKVVTFLDEIGQEVKLDPIKAYFQRHGIMVETEAKPLDGRLVGQAILDEVDRMQAGLLVMGAYTHSKVREMVFGGTTRDILEQSRIGVVLAH